MFIKIKDLELRNLEFDEAFSPGVIDLGEGVVQTEPLKAAGRAELIRESRGARNIVEDIRFVGSFSTAVQGRCDRCLDQVGQKVAEKFDLLYRPIGIDRKGDDVSISQAETEIGYYQGDGLLLEDVLKEQILLALPARQLCRNNCKGFCPQCGKNLNAESCDCVTTMPDPRWAALEDIRKKLES
jgi:uncharacterized protein